MNVHIPCPKCGRLLSIGTQREGVVSGEGKCGCGRNYSYTVKYRRKSEDIPVSVVEMDPNGD